MRISFSTIFQVAALIVKDVLAFEAQQAGSNTLPTAPAAATDSATPVAPNLDAQDDQAVTP